MAFGLFFGRVCRSASRLLLLGARVGHGPARTSRTGAKMMFGKHVVTICAVAAALVAGCNNPKRDQEKADQAQREAAQKTEQAQREAQDQAAHARVNAQQEQLNANDSLAKARAEY